jgi:hypothetical protein
LIVVAAGNREQFSNEFFQPWGASRHPNYFFEWLSWTGGVECRRKPHPHWHLTLKGR